MENNSNESNENKKPAFPLLRTSKLGALRPSAFSLNTDKNDDASSTTNGSQESTSKIFNPFMKIAASETDDDNVEKPSTTSTTSDGDDQKKDNIKEVDPISTLARNGIPKSNLFANAAVPISTSNPGFVFGENVHERVTGEVVQSVFGSETNTKKENETSTSEQSTITTSTDGSATSSTTGLLFSSVVQSVAANTSDTPVTKETPSKSLTEAAREYEESRAQKRKYGEVETFTGEEDENNVIEVNGKLFTFASQTYEERGRGALRLNDSKKKGESSRVVFRTAGNLRVLVNTKIWSGMVAERPSQKSLRFTALDAEGHVKVFLIMASPELLNQLHKHLTERINIEKTRTTDVTKPSSTEGGEDAVNAQESEEKQKTTEKEETDEPSPKKPFIET